MRSANPALTDRAFEAAAYEDGRSRSSVMTVNGAVLKTFFLVGLLVVAGGVSWAMTYPNGLEQGANPTYRIGFLLGGLLGGLVTGLILIFAPKAAPILAPVYAVCEGALLAMVSSFFALRYEGIVPQAVLLTVGVLGVMLLAYVTGVIRATPLFTKVLLIAISTICVFYLARLLLPMLGVGSEFFAATRGGPIGLAISGVVCVVAALSLILDFDQIETGARVGAPKYMEWYAAYGLLVSLVWLYFELLRLLSILRSSD
jgi:uncharacterized YccA/Bax inhibitor family protein